MADHNDVEKSLKSFSLDTNFGNFLSKLGINLISLVAELGAIYSLFSSNYKDFPLFIKILYWVSVVTFIIFNTFVINRFIVWRRELIYRNDFITRIVNKIDPVFVIKQFREEHIIQKNGSSKFTRTVQLERINDDVYWYEMALGTTVENGKSIFKKRHFHASNPDRSRDGYLPYVPYETSDKKTKLAIIVSPPIDEANRTTSIHIRYKWPKIWSTLIDKRVDKGRINLKYPVTKFEYKIVLPKGYALDRLSCKKYPYNKNWRMVLDENECEKHILEVDNVEKGTISYDISIKLK